MKEIDICKARRDILKALVEHSYETAGRMNHFSYIVLPLSHAQGIVRYHLSKAIKNRVK